MHYIIFTRDEAESLMCRKNALNCLPFEGKIRGHNAHLKNKPLIFSQWPS